MILLLVSPAAAAMRPRDTVIETPSVGSALISASTDANRYPVDDGSGEAVTVSVTDACEAACTAANPQQIADLLGTLIHGPEMELLTVQLDTPSQIEFDCGYGAEACYYGGDNKIVLSGDDTPAPEGASREFVLAHEYGHHVAQHRENPAPFPPAIDWGAPSWSSYEHVCQGSREGEFFPGNEGLHYFRDPGEAFAESFAHLRFPESEVPWRWPVTLKPDDAAFQAIREDTLDPWEGRRVLELRGQAPPRHGRAAVRAFGTPLDGLVSLRPAGRPRYELSLLNPAGRILRTSRHGFSFRHQLNYTVCGQSRLRIAIRSSRPSGGGFELQIQRP
jgi:hypothetical protein